MMNRTKFALLGCLLLLPVVAAAQKPETDPFADYVFPPELVMQNQQAIGLTEEQKSSIKLEIQRVTSRFTDLQWEIQAEAEKLAAVLKERSVDEQQAMAHLDKMLGIEREIKRLQISLVIRIKNRLTEEQQIKLRAVRRLLDTMKEYVDLKKAAGEEQKKRPGQQ